MGNFDDFIAEQAALTKQLHPEAFAAPVDPAESGHSLGDLVRSVGAGLDQMGTAGGKGLSLLGFDRAGQYVQDLYRDREKQQYENMTPAMKESMAKTILTSDEQGNVTGLGEALADPWAIANMAAQSLPQMAAGMGVGMGVTRGLIAAGRGLISPGTAGIIGGGIGEGGTAGVMAASQIQDEIMALPEATLAASPEYQALLQVMDPASARAELAGRAAMQGGLEIGASTALISAPINRFTGKILGGEAKSLVPNMLKSGAGESLTEAPQSGAEQYITNLQVGRADPTRAPMKGVFESAAQGAVVGLPFGMGEGAISHSAAVEPLKTTGQMAEQVAAQAAGQEKPKATTEIVPLAQPQAPQIPGMEASALPEQGTPGDSAALMAALRDVRAQQFGRENLQADGGRGPFEAPGVDPFQAGVPPQIQTTQAAPGYDPLAAENDAWMNAPVPPQEGPADVAALEAFRREQAARAVMQPEQELGFPQAQTPAAPAQTVQPTFDRELEQALNEPLPWMPTVADHQAAEDFRREQMAREVMQPEADYTQPTAPAAPTPVAQPTFDRELEQALNDPIPLQQLAKQAQDMEPVQPEVTVEPLARPSLPTTSVRAEGAVPATDLLASPQDRATVLPGEAKAVEMPASTQALQEPVSAPPAAEPTQTTAKAENAQQTAAPSVAPTAEPQPEAGKVLRVFPTPGGNVEVAKTGSSFTVTMRGEDGTPIQAGENFKSETDAVRAAKRLAQPKSEPAAVQTQPQAAPSLAELEAKLGPDTADFIRRKVTGLGGVEAVSQRYRNNDAVSRYARAFADQHFAAQAEATSEAAQPTEAEAAPQVEQKPTATQPAEAVQEEPAPQPAGDGGGTAGGEVAKPKPKSKPQKASKEERTLAKMEAEVRQKHLRDLKHRVTDFDGNPREVRITREGPDHVSVRVKDFRGEWVQMPNQSMPAGGSKKDVQRNKFWPDDLARETFQSTHKGQFASIWPARYTEFHIDSIKRPTAAQMNLTKSVLPTWMAIEAKGEKGWSDGRMADFGNLPYKEDPKNYLLDHDPEPKDFTRIIGRVSYSDPKLTPRFIQQDGEGGKIIFSVDGESRLVSAPIRDFAYFVSKYGKGEITLHQRSDEEPIGVVKAGEIDPVGVFMPMKQPPDRPLDLAEIRRQIQEDSVGKDGKAIREADEQEQPAEARQEEEAATQKAQPEQEPVAAPEETAPKEPATGEPAKAEIGMKFGEEIGGSRYDRSQSWLTVADLADMTDREREAYVVKNNVWPAMKYDALVEAGVPAPIAYLIKRVRDSIPAGPPKLRGKSTQEAQEIYIRAVERVRDVLARVKTAEDLTQGLEQDGSRTPLFDTIFDKSLYDQAKPSMERWSPEGRAMAQSLGGNKFVRNVQINSGEVRWAQRKVEVSGWPAKKSRSEMDGPKQEQYKRPILEDVKRVGEDYRQGKDMTPEDFQEAFGFRGGEFGKWLSQSDRQESLNHAYDALMDLAKTMGVPAKALSLNGELGFAFGARGGGKHSAHYEPVKVVINLTKTRGAGALAHEWFHAMDDYFGRLSGDRTSDRRYTSHGKFEGWNPQAKAFEVTSKMRPKMIEAWEGVIHALENLGGKRTEFSREASKLGNYWGRGHEKAARAFESYIQDKVEGGGSKSQYLVHGTEERRAGIYPLGEERQSINAAFDKFFATVKTKETERGVAMFRPGGKDAASSKEIAEKFNALEPVRITGEEIANMSQEPLNIAELRKKALEYVDSEDFRNEATNQNDGSLILIPRKSVKGALSHGAGPEKIQAVAALPGMLEHAVPVGSESSYSGRREVRHYYAAKFSLAGKEYVAGLVVREDANGRRFYDHELSKIVNPEAVFPRPGAALESESGQSPTPRGSVMDIVREALGVNADVLFKKGQDHNSSGLTAAKVKAALKGTAFEGLTVLDSPEDLTDRQFYRQLEEAGQLGAKGAYDPNTGEAYVFAGNNADMADAFVTAAHEGGHEGIGVLRANAARSMGGDVRQGAHAVDNILDAIYAANARKIQKEIALGEYKELDMRDAKDRRRATEEWLMANEPTQTRWYDKYVAAMTRFMRAMAKHLGVQIAWTNTETRDFLAKAYEARQQGGEDVRVLDSEGAVAYRKASPIPTAKQSLADMDELLKDVEITTSAKNDIGLVRTYAALPHWIAKDFPVFAKLYDRQLSRREERSTRVTISLGEAQSFLDLKGKDLDKARDVIWKIEGKKIEELGKWHEADGKLANGRTKLALREDHYKALESYIQNELGGSASVAKAVADVRRALDSIYVETFNRFSGMAEADDGEIAKMRQSLGKIDNYFPHMREGDFYVRAVSKTEKDENGQPKTLFRQHFDVLGGTKNDRDILSGPRKRRVEEAAKRIILENKAAYPGATWDFDEVKKLPETVFQYPIPVEAMDQVLKAVVAKLPEDVRGDAGKLMAKGFSDELKARGAGQHFIARKGTPGFETQDVQKIFFDHVSSMHGFLTKMDAARDFTKYMYDFDAKAEPKLYNYGLRYMQDMLQNSDKTDRAVGLLKSIGFAKYLGFRVSTAVVNLTQNIISGIPTLGMHTDKAGRYYWSALGDITALAKHSLTGKLDKLKGITDDESKLLHELYAAGDTRAQFMEDTRLQIMGNPATKVWAKALEVAGWPMEVSERFNRASLALAAYRAARAGHVDKAETLGQFHVNPGQKFGHDNAVKFARMIVNDAHFVYDKGNMPQPLRGSDAGKLASSAYQFRRFTHNMLGLWSHMWKSGDRGKKALAQSFAGLIGLGGLAAVPLYKTLMASIMGASGDDGEEWLRRKVGGGLAGDLLIYGLPALTGGQLASSIGMDLPVVSNMTDKGSNPIWDLMGIPGAFVRETGQSLAALKAGNVGRALAMSPVTPSIVRNAMEASRLATEGAYTQTGKPIPKLGEHGPMKLTTAQAIAKALGFSPVELANQYAAAQSMEAQNEFRLEAQSKFANRYVNAKRRNDLEEMREIRAQVKEWNAQALKDKKRYMAIDLATAVRSRGREQGPPKRMAGRAKELQSVY